MNKQEFGQVIVTISMIEPDFEALKIIRSYFGKHDKTTTEHLAYAVLDRIIKQIEPTKSKAALEPEEI